MMNGQAGILSTHRGGARAAIWCTRVVGLYLLVDTLSYLMLGGPAIGGRADELTALALMLVALPCLGRALTHPPLRVLIFVACTLSVIGAISALSNPMLEGAPMMRAVITGTLIDSKIFICAIAFAAILLNCDQQDRDRTVRTICLMLVFLAVFNGLLQVLDLLRGTDLHGRALLRRGAVTVPQGLFDHKYKSAFFNLLGLVALLSLHPVGTAAKVRHWTVLALLISLTLITLSIKEIAALLMILTLCAIRGRGLASIYFIGIAASAAAVALVVTPNPVGQAFVERWALFVSGADGLTVRAGLHLAALEIAQARFPLGAGTGSFGSSPAHEIFYSPYYHFYGISELYGGSEWNGAFLTDTFWPKVLGENGFIGLALFAGLWAWLGLRALRLLDQRSQSYAVLGFFALLVVSLATPVYTYAHGAIFGGLILGMLVSARMDKV